MKYVVLCLLGVIAVIAPAGQSARAQEKPAKACVEKIHVIKGCSACEAMQDWLRRGGVELDVTNVSRGAYKLYPTVTYSDKSADHGERMYKQQVTIPGTICVISCAFGTN